MDVPVCWVKGSVLLKTTPRKNPDRLRSYLRDIDFPVGKEEILLRAESSRVPDDIMEVFLAVPNREYQDQADVLRGIYQGK